MLKPIGNITIHKNNEITTVKLTTKHDHTRPLKHRHDSAIQKLKVDVTNKKGIAHDVNNSHENIHHHDDTTGEIHLEDSSTECTCVKKIKAAWVQTETTLRAASRSTADPCVNVCKDLTQDDVEPVCMMFSRYKRGYQWFMNQCHARRAICLENMDLHLVHPSRCMKTRQFFMPII